MMMVVVEVVEVEVEVVEVEVEVVEVVEVGVDSVVEALATSFIGCHHSISVVKQYKDSVIFTNVGTSRPLRPGESTVKLL